MEIYFAIGGLVVGFVVGILVGRSNKKLVDKVVAEVEKRTK